MNRPLRNQDGAASEGAEGEGAASKGAVSEGAEGVTALTVRVDRSPSAPTLIDQLVLQIRRKIETAGLAPGARLPSSRVLSRELGVSRTVVTEVYSILIAEGYVQSRAGSGTFVSASFTKLGHFAADAESSDAPQSDLRGAEPLPRWLHRPVEPPAVDPEPAAGESSFLICEPEPCSFPDAAWRTCARAAISESLPRGYASEEGDLGLREAIASFVARERGLACSARDVVVTSGTTQALDLLARLTLEPGDPVAFEDPGYRLARQIFTDHGAKIQPVSVDGEGLRVSELEAIAAPRLVYATPSHQFPMGSVLSYCRRTELLDWAARHDALVIEDDYDSEFRFDGPALPPLAAQESSAPVVYLGTFSKCLSPSLRLGYVIANPALRQALVRLRARTDHGTSWPLQRALARYLSSGAFGRHLRRMRRLYRERRDVLIAALEPLPAGSAWVGLAAGLHATLSLPPGMASEVVAACRDRRLLVRRLADYRLGPVREGELEGLVLGYGAASAQDLDRMAETLREVMGT